MVVQPEIDQSASLIVAIISYKFPNIHFNALSTGDFPSPLQLQLLKATWLSTPTALAALNLGPSAPRRRPLAPSGRYLGQGSHALEKLLCFGMVKHHCYPVFLGWISVFSEDGSLITWGHPRFGGRTDVLCHRNSVTQLLAPMHNCAVGFVALLSDGCSAAKKLVCSVEPTIGKVEINHYCTILEMKIIIQGPLVHFRDCWRVKIGSFV